MMTINEIELASELAHDALVTEMIVTGAISDEDDLFRLDEGDVYVYKNDLIQDMFNQKYDYFYAKIEECHV